MVGIGVAKVVLAMPPVVTGLEKIGLVDKVALVLIGEAKVALVAAGIQKVALVATGVEKVDLVAPTGTEKVALIAVGAEKLALVAAARVEEVALVAAGIENMSLVVVDIVLEKIYLVVVREDYVIRAVAGLAASNRIIRIGRGLLAAEVENHKLSITYVTHSLTPFGL